MIPTPLFASLLYTAAFKPVTADPLFQKMLGHWEGNGVRTQTVSGRMFQVHTVTSTTLSPPPGHENETNYLFSHNEVTERLLTEPESTAPAKSYTREYWIRPAASSADHYEFVTLKNAELRVSSLGEFQNDTLVVHQKILLGTALIEVRSQTRFIQTSSGSTESDYQDETYMDGQLTSKSQIHYR